MQQQETEQLKLLMNLKGKPITIELDSLDIFMTVSALQLTNTHTGLGPDMLHRLEKVARKMQDLLAPDKGSELYKFIELGWNREFDVETRKAANDGV